MKLDRLPCVSLQPFVERLWAVDEEACAAHAIRREHVLPTGQMHLVVRLRPEGLRIFAGARDRTGTAAAQALIGGARDTFYIREVTGPQSSVGVQFRPGGAEALFGIPVEEFSGRHTRLDEVWNSGVTNRLADRLASVPLGERLDMLEAELLARTCRLRGLHPAVARALTEFSVRSRVGQVIAGSGYSHRTMISLFRRSVGLAPKDYARTLRFRRALKHLRAGRSLVDVAVAAGFSDQAHFSREFLRITGTTASVYRRIAPTAAHHLPVDGHTSNSFKTGVHRPGIVRADPKEG